MSSSIEWTEETWNPVTGCNKVSPGCKFCYAERMAHRLQAMGMQSYKDAFKVTLHPDRLGIPYKWKTPKVCFVNSMSDMFHKDVPLEYIQKCFTVMHDTQRHVYQILTKRSERLAELQSELVWSPNIWMGVSVENENYMYRIDDLRKVDAAVRFLSLEPLLGPLPNLDLSGIHWVIVGGESGPGARPMSPEWVDQIHQQCVEQEVPFFFKQWGGVRKDKTGRLLHGRTYDEMPHVYTNLINKAA